MKWPNTLTLLRHGQSAFNALKERRQKDPLWQAFAIAFDENHLSDKIKKLAERVKETFQLDYSDYETPLTKKGRNQARAAGEHLKTLITLPDVVILSPYLRCRDTFEEAAVGWPELKSVKTYTDELIEERHTGLAALCNDWRLFFTFHPEQYLLDKKDKYYHYCYPQGESVKMVRRRVRQWFNTLTREFAGKNVFVVTHHLTILSIRANLERMTPEEFMELDRENPPKNCSITIYRGNPNIGSDGKLTLDPNEYNITAPIDNEEEK